MAIDCLTNLLLIFLGRWLNKGQPPVSCDFFGRRARGGDCHALQRNSKLGVNLWSRPTDPHLIAVRSRLGDADLFPLSLSNGCRVGETQKAEHSNQSSQV